MQEENKGNSNQKIIPRRKLINKVRRKIKKQNERLAHSYKQIQNQPRSALGSFMQDNVNNQNDFDMLNHISTGQTRKMKKKLKKLQKKFQNKDKIFGEMQKYKESMYKKHQKTIFNPVNQMEKRRQKRMKKMMSNTKRTKNDVFHKKNKKPTASSSK